MKFTTLLLVTTLLISGCTISPENLALIPEQDPASDSVLNFEQYDEQEFILYGTGGMNITHIRMANLESDSWLHKWATKSMYLDFGGTGVKWAEHWVQLFTWTYANVFAGAELRCAESRDRTIRCDRENITENQIQSHARHTRFMSPDTG